MSSKLIGGVRTKKCARTQREHSFGYRLLVFNEPPPAGCGKKISPSKTNEPVGEGVFGKGKTTLVEVRRNVPTSSKLIEGVRTKKCAQTLNSYTTSC